MKVYIIPAAECEKLATGEVRLTESSKGYVEHQGNILLKSFETFSNCILTGPSNSAKCTAFCLKRKVQVCGKNVSYKEMPLLTDCKTIREAVKKTYDYGYKHCVLIAKKGICSSFIKTIAENKSINDGEVCIFDYEYGVFS